MKLYVLRERWGRYLLSPRGPAEKPIPKEPVVEAGVGIEMIDWGDWAVRPFAERVIIWNFLVRVAVDTLGLYGPKAIAFIQASITQSIIWEATWGLWLWAGAIGVYAAVMFALVYFGPVQRKFVSQEVFPWRYLFRYQSKVWAADLYMIGKERKLYYRICSEIGEIIVGEDRMAPTLVGIMDVWDTGHLWQQRRDSWMKHECWLWSYAFVEYIGNLTHVAENVYVLKKGFTDPYTKELPVPYKVPDEFLCREWRPDYRMP